MSTDLPAPPQASEPQPAPKKKGLPKWLIGIIAVIVVGGGVYAFNYFSSDVAQAKAGDCAKVAGTTSKPEYAAVACDSADANVTVGKALSSTTESCGSDSYLEFTQTARRGPDTKLCLVPKFEEGQCYKMEEGESVNITKQACGPGAIKVAKVIKGTVDKAQCGEGGGGLEVPEPATTYCLEQAGA